MGLIRLFIKVFVVLILIIIFMVVSVIKAEAWVGGKLEIQSPLDREEISGKIIFHPGIAGDFKVSNTQVYGKSRDTNLQEFKLLGENMSCQPWDANEGIPCNVMINTNDIEDSSIWQFYMTAQNASDSADIVKSPTITEVIVDNTKPSFQLYKFLSPQDGEILGTSSVSVGALVEAEFVTHCFIEFTSNTNPGQREYKTDVEKNEYCNLTITNVPEGFYTWNILASDGKDKTQKINGGKFEVRSPKDISKFEQTEEKKGLPETSNIAIIIILVILILILVKRRHK